MSGSPFFWLVSVQQNRASWLLRWFNLQVVSCTDLPADMEAHEQKGDR